MVVERGRWYVTVIVMRTKLCGLTRHGHTGPKLVKVYNNGWQVVDGDGSVLLDRSCGSTKPDMITSKEPEQSLSIIMVLQETKILK